MLIPPQTAGIYARLLKAEAIELAKNDRNSAEELKHIEYLKDVMVRKCEKIAIWKARTSPSPQPKQVKSATAPVDFRLRRMEQWWEQRRVAEDGNANNGDEFLSILTVGIKLICSLFHRSTQPGIFKHCSPKGSNSHSRRK